MNKYDEIKDLIKKIKSKREFIIFRDFTGAEPVKILESQFQKEFNKLLEDRLNKWSSGCNL